MYCHKCGGQMPQDANFCNNCGEASRDSSGGHGSADYRRRGFMGNDYTASFHPSDIEANKGVSIVSYILFFIPLLIAPDSKYTRFHVNQGLIVFIVSIIVNIMQNVFRIGNWWSFGWSYNWSSWSFNPFSITISLLQVALIACIIYGIINAINGKAVELPLIGKFRIIT
jgi:uncharacterized membrane protein